MNRIDRLDARVRELEASFTKLQQAAENGASASISYQIPGDLGEVWVTGTGRLQAIELAQANLHYTTAQALGQQLADAIRTAESEARENRQDAVAAAKRRRPTQQVLTAYRRH